MVIALAFGESAAGSPNPRPLEPSPTRFETIHARLPRRLGRMARQSGLHAALESLQPTGDMDLEARLTDEALFSATVIKTHEDRTLPGALGCKPLRALGEAARGYPGRLPSRLAARRHARRLCPDRHRPDRGRNSSFWHISQDGRQLPDGHWPQNYYPSGEAFLDRCPARRSGIPILLAAKLQITRLRVDTQETVPNDHAMRRSSWRATDRQVIRTVGRRMPASTPFTLAVAIAALVAAEPWLEGEERDYALDLADDWNARDRGLVL